MQSVHSVLHTAQAQLCSMLPLNLGEARFEAQLLLQHALKVNRAWLIAHEHDVIDAGNLAKFESLLNRRLNGEPVAYILGKREFYGLNLSVTPDTLIPRADTELLVDKALEKIPADQASQVLDLGTGTGAIALAIAHHRKQAQVTASDASPAALNVAKANSRLLAITNVRFVSSHWFDALNHEQFDIIVSNPPYIEQDDAHLRQGDLRFEPVSALASGADGLDDIRQIIDNCLLHLKPQGWLLLEHGYNQAGSVADLMAHAGLVDVETFTDLGGNNRVTIGKNPLIVSTHWD